MGADNDNCTLHALKLQIVAVSSTKQNKKARVTFQKTFSGSCLQSSEAEKMYLPVTLKPMLLTGEPAWSAMHLMMMMTMTVMIMMVVVVVMMVMLRCEDDRCVGLMSARFSTGSVQVKAAGAQVPKAYPALPSQAELDFTQR